jgi:hypothetical protein
MEDVVKHSLANAVIVLLALVVSGCHVYAPLNISVGDAETGKPIAGALVDASYFFEPFGPSNTTSATDERGKSTMPVPAGYSPMLHIRASGYWLPGSGHRNLPVEGCDCDTKRLQVWLYRVPVPSIELVIPNGYRGLIRLNLRPATDRIQDEPGKRHFVFHASSSGFVNVRAAPLLMDLDFMGFAGKATDLIARYEDGTPIPKSGFPYDAPATEDNQVALRWVGQQQADNSNPSDSGFLFAIGTQGEVDELRHVAGGNAINAWLHDPADFFRGGKPGTTNISTAATREAGLPRR